MARKRRKASKPFKLPPLNFAGIGVVYVLLYFPQLWAIKIGYTGRSIKSRVRGTSRAVFGFTVPIFFCIVPFAWNVEQALHAMLLPLKLNFYKGDGHTETFWLPAGVFAIAAMLGVWWAEYQIFMLTLV